MSSQSWTKPHLLGKTLEEIRSSAAALHGYIDEACDRLETVDPKILAFLDEPGRRERLHREADALLARFSSEEKPPLYGALCGVKDIYRVDGFATKAGSQLPAEIFEGAEASVVTKLRESGALVLGKCVTTEFAYFEPGPTRNPHDTQRTPGGSSSGSAAAVAAGLCAFSLGTQTVGSVLRPAAFCGVVGFKPSYGRIDPSGLIFFSPSLDHVGYFTQDVAGARAVSTVVCRDWTEPTEESLPVLGVPVGTYLDMLDEEDDSRVAFEAQLGLLEAAGYVVKRTAGALDDLQRFQELHSTLCAKELADVHKDWFAAHEPLYRPRTAALIHKGQLIEDAADAKRGQLELRQRLEGFMDAHGIDLFVSPSAPGVAPLGVQSTGDPKMNQPWTYAGLPALSVPVLAPGSLPLGLQLVARFNHDERLLHWAQPLADVFFTSDDS
mmetsp:Transcript_10874/g.32711  ORF Transcript_10874/g.32711 Transcript_10874/m.32711 type:complete len:439 (+) Transcript_10874:248-1564(+)